MVKAHGARGGYTRLQGIKRGIMEVCDLIVINKAGWGERGGWGAPGAVVCMAPVLVLRHTGPSQADGDLKPAAERACAEHTNALRLMRHKSRHWCPEAWQHAVRTLVGMGWSSLASLHCRRWVPQVLTVSALEKRGLAEVRDAVLR
jgi:putative protein kinase ArgK-like GTPase of G3E family